MSLKFLLLSFLSRNTLSRKHDIGVLFTWAKYLNTSIESDSSFTIPFKCNFRTVIHSRFSERRRPRPKIAETKGKRSAATAFSMTSSTPAAESRDVSKSSEHHAHYYQKRVKSLIKAAHILHYCSIAILGVFVIQVRRYVDHSTAGNGSVGQMGHNFGSTGQYVDL